MPDEVAPLTGTTPGDALPYPNDYQQPADSPSAFQQLANAVQAALDTKPDTAYTEASYVKGPKGTQVLDWDTAVESGFYWSAPGAGHNPATTPGEDYWLGVTVGQSNPNYAHQTAWPFGATGAFPPAVTFHRTRTTAGWGAWVRLGNYAYAWDIVDNMTSRRHGPNAVPRFAEGYVKGGSTSTPADSDEWRVQCYNTDGVFTWSAIKIPESGIVSMPRGHALMSARIRSGEPIPADTVLTVGMLAEILRAGVGPGELNVGPPTEEA